MIVVALLFFMFFLFVIYAMTESDGVFYIAIALFSFIIMMCIMGAVMSI